MEEAGPDRLVFIEHRCWSALMAFERPLAGHSHKPVNHSEDLAIRLCGAGHARFYAVPLAAGGRGELINTRAIESYRASATVEARSQPPCQASLPATLHATGFQLLNRRDWTPTISGAILAPTASLAAGQDFIDSIGAICA